MPTSTSATIADATNDESSRMPSDSPVRADSCRSNKSDKSGRPMSNGFYMIPEQRSIECVESSISQWSLPQEALVYEADPETVVYKFKNGDQERKIHCNVELSELEKDQLKELQRECKKNGQSFLPSITIMSTRFLSRARGDPQKAIKLMEETQAWRQSYFKDGPVTDSQVFEDLQHGIVYFTGRDQCLRPTLVLRPYRIPPQWYKEKCIDRFVRVLVFCMEYMMRYMVVPGRIENNNLIVDLKGMGIAQVSISVLSEVNKVMGHHYIGRIFKFYVVNLSGMLSYLATPVKNLMTDRQQQKICILNKVSELLLDFAPHHLEVDLAGTMPAVKTFFPWPLMQGPFDPAGKTGPNKDALPGGHRCLTEAGSMGRLWNPKKTKRDNLSFELTDEAYDFFSRCGYTIPAHCPLPPALLSEQEVLKTAEEVGDALQQNGGGSGIDSGGLERQVSGPSVPGGRVSVNPDGLELLSLEHLWKGSAAAGVRISARKSQIIEAAMGGQPSDEAKLLLAQLKDSILTRQLSSGLPKVEEIDPHDLPEEGPSDSEDSSGELHLDLAARQFDKEKATPNGWFGYCGC